MLQALTECHDKGILYGGLSLSTPVPMHVNMCDVLCHDKGILYGGWILPCCRPDRRHVSVHVCSLWCQRLLAPARPCPVLSLPRVGPALLRA